MLWTPLLPPWVACGFEGKGCEFIFPDAICMQLADNYGLFICTWPQIIPDWCLADGLNLLQISHMFHQTPKWAGIKYAFIGSFYIEKREASTPRGTAAWEATIGKGGNVSFSLISLGIQKAESKKEITCSQKYSWPQGLSPKWFRFTLRNCKEINHPHVKPWRFHWNDEIHGFFCLLTWLSPSNSPSHIFFLLHERLE